MPSPYWVSYPEQVRLVGAVPVGVPDAGGHGVRSRSGRGSRAAVTPRTKVVDSQQPEQSDGRRVLAGRARRGRPARRGAEPASSCPTSATRPLTFEGRHVSIAALDPEVKARTLVVNTCSKAYAMTGWRIGFAAGPRELIRAMTDVQSQVTSNPSSIAQWAAVEALTGPQDEVAKMAGEFDRRRRIIVPGLNALPGVSCVDAEGRVLRFRERLEAVRPAVEERRRPVHAQGLRRRHRVSSRGGEGGRRARPSTSAPTITCACRTRPAKRSSGRAWPAWPPRSRVWRDRRWRLDSPRDVLY